MKVSCGEGPAIEGDCVVGSETIGSLSGAPKALGLNHSSPANAYALQVPMGADLVSTMAVRPASARGSGKRSNAKAR